MGIFGYIGTEIAKGIVKDVALTGAAHALNAVENHELKKDAKNREKFVKQAKKSAYNYSYIIKFGSNNLYEILDDNELIKYVARPIKQGIMLYDFQNRMVAHLALYKGIKKGIFSATEYYQQTALYINNMAYGNVEMNIKRGSKTIKISTTTWKLWFDGNSNEITLDNVFSQSFYRRNNDLCMVEFNETNKEIPAIITAIAIVKAKSEAEKINI